MTTTRERTWLAAMAKAAEILEQHDDGTATGADLVPAFAGIGEALRRSMLGRFCRLGWLERVPARRGEPAWRHRYRIGECDGWRRGVVGTMPNHLEPCPHLHRAILVLAYSVAMQQRQVGPRDQHEAELAAFGARELAVDIMLAGLDADAELRATIVHRPHHAREALPA